MFDIGVGEMMILAVIALLVFGPERLPGAANDAARMVRQARAALRGTTSLIEESTGITATEVRDQLEQLNRMRPQTIAQSLWSDDESDPGRDKGGPEPQVPSGPSEA
jgi:sec-independent protein translocase protein TatB